LAIIVLILLAILAKLLFGSGSRESKPRDNRLLSYEGMKVCSKNGTLVGRVDEAVLENKKVLAWRISLKHELAENMKRDSIIVRREHVHSIKDVMVLDAKTSDYLEKFH
jgi:sporulation protein YlmC with PRC-barrel domain